jgi:OmpA-OmpF porin, OOP family
MKVFLYQLFFFILIINSAFSQAKLKGVWQGIMQRDGMKENDAHVFYIAFLEDGKTITGKTRTEVYGTDLYAVQKMKGTQKGNQFEFNEFVIESKKITSKIIWCSADFKGEYSDSTGYISGTFASSTCKRVTGTFILYRSKAKFSDGKDAPLGHAWRDVFLKDLKNKRKAPELREKDRENFQFKPVYFDYDKYEIKAEYTNFLKEMIEIVNGHSDLRIQITGHTDADGSIQYNDDLSKKRAKAIEDFFRENGLDTKKLKIDFKGELEPVDNNNTPEGKQRNRRVDFMFIYN